GNGGYRRLLEGVAVDQINTLGHAESRLLLFQVLEDVPARYATVLQSSSALHANDFLRRAGLARAKRGGDRGPANVRADLEDISHGDLGEVIDEKQDIHM